MRKLFTVMFSLTLMLIGLTCAAKDFIPGQTYYITGRQVFVRLEPNTGGETYGYWRFGTPVTYVRSENGFALVSRPNENTTLYVYADYLGDVSEMKAKKKPYTD